MSERDLINSIMAAFSPMGVRLFRNNCGIAIHADGSRVQYGVANPGGSDLIGWSPLIVGPEHVGMTLAIFSAVEVKFGSTKTTPAQTNFIRAVNARGGNAGIARNHDDVRRILRL